MTTLNLNQVIHNEDDSVTTEKVDGKEVQVTLRKVLRRALSCDLDKNGAPLTDTDKKLQRYELWAKVKSAISDGDVLAEGTTATDFTPEELTMLREAVLVFPTVTCGQVRAMLK